MISVGLAFVVWAALVSVLAWEAAKAALVVGIVAILVGVLIGEIPEIKRKLQ